MREGEGEKEGYNNFTNYVNDFQNKQQKFFTQSKWKKHRRQTDKYKYSESHDLDPCTRRQWIWKEQL